MADNTMALQLRAAMKNLQTATQSAAVMAGQLNAFSNKLNTKGGLADKMLTDTATFNRILQAATQLQAAANNASLLPTT
jgi:phospholipid/cholesterol/gamma-HCH transport system substrate-binding protein